MATKPTVATVATGQDITSTLWNNQVYNLANFLMNTQPKCQLTASAGQSVNASTFTSINFDTEVIDTDSQHSTVSNTSRVVIGGTLGWYRCSGVVTWSATTTASRFGAQLALNGTAQNGTQVFSANNQTTSSALSVSLPPFIVQSTVSTDYVEIQGWQNTAGALSTLVSGAFRCSFLVEYDGTLS